MDCRDLHAQARKERTACGELGASADSSRCPQCGHKPKGRQWHCKKCGFTGHRDLVGSVNMHEDFFTKLIACVKLKGSKIRRRSVAKFTSSPLL